MHGIDAILVIVFVLLLPCLIFLSAIFADITIDAHYCGELKIKKTKVKETIEDKYDRLTKETYDA